jgi:predicted esterase
LRLRLRGLTGYQRLVHTACCGLPPLDNAKGKRFYLLQSPDDQVTPLRFAEEAESALSIAGAKVHLHRQEGGHGWHGDMWGMLRAGIEWLEREARESKE